MGVCEIKIKAFIPEATLEHPNKFAGSTFDGDNRGFSYNGSYRIAQYIKVDLDDLEIIANMAMTGTTCENRSDGKHCGKAGTSEIKIENVRVTNEILHFTAVAGVSNPLVSVAPDIDYEIYVSVRKNGRVCVTGKHDGFPNYEVWRRVNYGSPENVYSYDHGSEKAWSLYAPMDKDIAVGTCS